MFRRLVMFSTMVAALLAVLFVVRPAGADAGAHPARETTVDDQYVFGRDAQIDSPVAGGVQVLFGSAVVNAAIAGDLVVIGGNVRFGPRGRVNGNLVHAGRVSDGDGRVGG
ncbi:MAG TPA: hypothetical protein VF057_11235, partial [Thermoanaerobaculia bacterium]